jgi:hypothetical protein
MVFSDCHVFSVSESREHSKADGDIKGAVEDRPNAWVDHAERCGVNGIERVVE